MAKPKILFLIDGLQVGGTERSLLELAKRFTYFTPVICVLSDSLYLLPAFQKFGIRVIPFPLPRNYRFAANAKRLMILVNEIQPALIHSYLFHSDMTLRYLPVAIPKISGLVSNSYSSQRIGQLSWEVRMKVGILKIWDKATSRNIDLFISNSRVISEAYSDHLGVPSKKIKIIPRGRDLKIFKASKSNKDSSKSFVSVGRLIASKGFRELIRAFAVFCKKHQGYTLIIAGEGPERINLENIINSLGLTGAVFLPGTLDRIEDFLSQANYFVFPSQYEGLPGSLIEAMMSRIPIICSDIPENKECVDESMCLFHKVGDQEDLLAQMERALNLRDWDQRTQKAFDFAAVHFNIEEIVKKYEEVYLKLLN